MYTIYGNESVYTGGQFLHRRFFWIICYFGCFQNFVQLLMKPHTTTIKKSGWQLPYLVLLLCKYCILVPKTGQNEIPIFSDNFHIFPFYLFSLVFLRNYMPCGHHVLLTAAFTDQLHSISWQHLMMGRLSHHWGAVMTMLRKEPNDVIIQTRWTAQVITFFWK